MSRKPTVLVVGAEENPALAMCESLSRRGVEVHAGSHLRLAPGFFSRYTAFRFLYPSPAEREEEFVEAVRAYVRKHGIEVVLAAGEDPTWILARHRERIAADAAVPLVNLATFVKCRDKSATMKIATAAGVPTPATWYPEEEAIDAIAKRVPYPVVLKPNVSDGARGISYPRDAGELVEGYRRTVATYGACHVQEFIPHTGMQYKAEFLIDVGGRVRARCAYSKLRYYPPSGGSSTLNRTVDRPDILESGARVLKQIGWYGMADCDFIEDPRDGVAKLMEINPRFTRSIRICLLAGVDFPGLLYAMAKGEPVRDALDYAVGVTMRYLPADLAWFVRSKDRFRARPGFLELLLRPVPDEVFTLRDPVPGVAYALSSLLALFDREERRHRLR